MGNLQQCVKCIMDGAAVDCRDNQNKTPLIHAAINGHLPMVILLLASGAQLNVRDNNNQTAYMHAKKIGNSNIYFYFEAFQKVEEISQKKYHLSKFPDTNVTKAIHANSPEYVSYAINNHHALLISSPIEDPYSDIEFQSKDYLHIAAQKRLLEIAKILLDHGYSAYKKDHVTQRTPLSHAFENDDLPMVILFLKKPNPRAKNDRGYIKPDDVMEDVYYAYNKYIDAALSMGSSIPPKRFITQTEL